jgi:sigma-B regulation protein RsbU (phosphoserine phosphatase)
MIDVMLEPAKEVGGDLVDYFPVGDELIALVLGDVSHKGAGAALMMARTHSMFRSLAARPDADALFRVPERAVALANAALAHGNANCMFVTFLLATFDLVTGRLAYVRAGHIPPYHRNGSGAVARLNRLGGPPLALDETAKYESDAVMLAPGDQVLIVTDGITEAHDPAGTLYGEQKVGEFVAGLRSPEAEPLQRLLKEVRAFEAGRPALDDAAAILLSLGP